MQRVVLRLACVLLLLFAQQGALTHAAWHAKSSTPAEQGSSGKASFHGGLCDLHHAFSQVLGGVQAAVPVCFAHPRGLAQHKPCLYSDGILSLSLPLCRGPPAFS